MLNNITLTSSMRSNLYALKNLSTQMNKTQNRLASGLKVNSAIDNANSYYQARALTNRASDLDMLLDAMGQSIQTISTAVTGLEKAGETLEQAAVIAQEAYEAAIIPEKAWFEAQVGPNGAVVTTAQELRTAINSGKEIICVYGKIDYFENEALTMKANQKLVGTEYFTGYSGNKKFSEINFKGTQASALSVKSNCLISDLSLNFEAINSEDVATNMLIKVYGAQDVVLNNLDLDRKIIGTDGKGALNGLILMSNDSTTIINGIVNIKSQGQRAEAISVYYGCSLEIAKDAILNIDCNDVKIGRPTIYIYRSESVNKNTLVDIYGKVNINTNTSRAFILGGLQYSGNSLNIYDGAEVTLNTMSTEPIYVGARHDENTYNTVNIESGAKVNLKDSQGTANLISDGYLYENNTNSIKYIYSTTLENSGDFVSSGNSIDWSTWSAVPEIKESDSAVALAQSSEQYATAMKAFDEMIEESSYQGVNLITGGVMTTMFNESRTHSLTVKGEDMRAENLGITIREWNTRDDIAQSIKEIKAAMSKVRDMVESLGNNLSIIQTRENFTDAMIDVLETGADDLVLADMNEESANYLALQTRNNLAVNALSLAAQAGSAVLKLF